MGKETLDDLIEKYRMECTISAKSNLSDSSDMEQFGEYAEKYQRTTETLDDDNR